MEEQNACGFYRGKSPVSQMLPTIPNKGAILNDDDILYLKTGLLTFLAHYISPKNLDTPGNL
jgi:hypothetical protein